jgi:hypothetical protein
MVLKNLGLASLGKLWQAFAVCGMCLALAGAVHASTVAITEFIVDPHGTDTDAPEWIELFNYGKEPVDIGGWTIKDNSSAAFTFPTGFTIAAGDYAISAINRQNFINRWLAGIDDSRVVSPGQTFQLNNSAPGDGLYLRDDTGNLIWSVGYNISAAEPVSQYRATFLAINDFSENNYGVPPQDGSALINRNGIDGTGTLGYEDNIHTADPFMVSSPAGGGGIEWGSPLRGHYSAIPEPSTFALLLGLASGLQLRRRAR